MLWILDFASSSHLDDWFGCAIDLRSEETRTIEAKS